MHYVISDLHGCFSLFQKMLKKIDFSESDTLYFLGDAADRGPDGIAVMRDLIRRPNVVCLLGNHEDMFRKCARAYGKRLRWSDREAYQRSFRNWTIRNGGQITWDAWTQMPAGERQEILDWMEALPSWQELTINGVDFLLAHAGVGAWEPEKDLSHCELYDFIWERMDYDKVYYKDKLLVTGHTPTFFIDRSRSGQIIMQNNHIAIDCGAVYTGTLGCLCLETLECCYCSEDELEEHHKS